MVNSEMKHVIDKHYQILSNSRLHIEQVLSSSSDGQPFRHNRHGPKIWWLCPLWGELDPHVTQCGLGRGLPSYQGHLDPSSSLATTDMGRKFGAVPLWGRGSWVPS